MLALLDQTVGIFFPHCSFCTFHWGTRWARHLILILKASFMQYLPIRPREREREVNEFHRPFLEAPLFYLASQPRSNPRGPPAVCKGRPLPLSLPIGAWSYLGPLAAWGVPTRRRCSPPRLWLLRQFAQRVVMRWEGGRRRSR